MIYKKTANIPIGKHKMETFAIPSKTFLAGEYVAPFGGPAIVINTAPKFTLEVGSSKEVQEKRKDGISAASPAGKFMDKYKDFFQNMVIRFKDPHGGKGGLGASSAQFAFCYFLKENQKNNLKENLKNSPKENSPYSNLHQEYLAAAWNGLGTPPSGADVIAQLLGGPITFYHKEAARLEQMAWPFSGISFSLFHTGHKVATHEHLSTLELKPDDFLDQLVESIWDNMKRKDEESFLENMRIFMEKLGEKKLICEETRRLAETISAWPCVRLIKGCGALGMDVVCVLYTTNEEKEIHRRAENLGLSPFATSLELVPGLLGSA